MVLCFLSTTLQLARHSSSPLWRQLCSTSTNKPVLTLFTKFLQYWAIYLRRVFYTALQQSYKLKRSSCLPMLLDGSCCPPSSAEWRIMLNFFQKPCPLCDEAKEVLEPYKRRFTLQEVDITLPENSAWCDKYRYDIPVFHLNGKFLMKHQVDIQKFEDQLTKLELQNAINQ